MSNIRAEISTSEGDLGNCVYIGQDNESRWVVQDARRLRGGLFINRIEALRFAFSETGGRDQAVIMVSGVMELRLR